MPQQRGIGRDEDSRRYSPPPFSSQSPRSSEVKRMAERPCLTSAISSAHRRPKNEMVADPEDVASPVEESSTDDDNASQTTEDDPQVPQPQPPTAESPNRPPPSPSTLRDGPRYELTHTMSGHTKSISAVKFSPDGTLLASCGVCFFIPIDTWMRIFLKTSCFHILEN